FASRVFSLRLLEIPHDVARLQAPRIRFFFQRSLRERGGALIGGNGVDAVGHLESVAEAAAKDRGREDRRRCDQSLAHGADYVSTLTRPSATLSPRERAMVRASVRDASARTDRIENPDLPFGGGVCPQVRTEMSGVTAEQAQ